MPSEGLQRVGPVEGWTGVPSGGLQRVCNSARDLVRFGGGEQSDFYILASLDAF